MILDIGAGASPFFSVILCTFNRRGLVAQAIESVRRQTFQDWELLVIDDGSRDRSCDVIIAAFQDDPRCRYHYSTNRGLPIARNIGLAISRGCFITFLDSDDEYRPEHLETRAGELLQHPEIELLHGGVEVIGPQTVADKFDPSRQIPVSECVVGGTFCIRRDLAERLGGFRDIPYGDDNDFFRRAQAKGAVIQKIDAPTYRYNRTTADSLCSIVERDGVEGRERFRRGQQ